MYGMSAKDRLAMFENKGNSSKKTNSGPKKIGKLKFGNNNKTAEETKKAVPSKKAKSTLVKDDKKDKENVEVNKNDNASKEQPKEEAAAKPAVEEKGEKTEEKGEKMEVEKVTKKDDKVIEKQEKLVEEKEPQQAEDTDSNKGIKTESKPVAESQIKDNPNELQKQEDTKEKQTPKKEKTLAKEDTIEKDTPKIEETKTTEVPKKEEIKTKEAPKKEEIKPKEAAKKEETKGKEVPKKEEIKAKETQKKQETKGIEAGKKAEVKDNKKGEKAEDASLQVKEDEVSKPEQPKDMTDAPVRKRRRPQFVPVPEEVYDTLFYFSGMGTVVGSAMNEGVYVPVRATKTALETDVIDKIEAGKEKEREQDTFVIRTARTQAFDIAEELRKLQGLLNGLPNFGEQNADLHKIDAKPFDSIMHAKYHNFQQVAQGPPRVKPLDVTLTTTRKDVPQKPVSQWPPPVIPAPEKPKETPISMHTVPPVQTKPVTASGKEKDVGVFKGVTSGAPSTKLAPKENQPRQGGARPFGVYTAKPESGATQSWQEKYGAKSVDDVRGPQPFQQEGEIPGGLKPWELSRLRGLEAKGYQFAHLEPKSGADYSDSFYHGSASLELEGVELTSLAPYLVSGRSQGVDREQKETQPPVAAATFSLKKHTGFGSHGENLPYCDL